jgi:CheY-like chemotaxis protein
VRLLAAMQGHLGLELAGQHRPDLILLDLDLPDMHGSDVLAALRKDPSLVHIPVVVISADATPGQIQRLQEAGARDYLTKPLDVRHFLALIDEMLLERQEV